jgi:hypothetical protein
VPRRIFGPKREEVVGDGEGCIMRSFITSMLLQILRRVIKSRRLRRSM